MATQTTCFSTLDPVFRYVWVTLMARDRPRITFLVTQRADYLHIKMMFCGIALVMVIFMAPTAKLIDVTTVNTRQRIWVRPVSSSHLNIDSLSCLLFVAISWLHWRRPRLASQWIYSWHGSPIFPPAPKPREHDQKQRKPEQDRAEWPVVMEQQIE